MQSPQSLVRKTIFYSDSADPSAKTVILAINQPYLSFYDKERGYVRKELLLQAFDIVERDITQRACVVEVLENVAQTFTAEVCRLPVY
jgi:hypothetical protein